MKECRDSNVFRMILRSEECPENIFDIYLTHRDSNFINSRHSVHFCKAQSTKQGSTKISSTFHFSAMRVESLPDNIGLRCQRHLNERLNIDQSHQTGLCSR